MTLGEDAQVGSGFGDEGHEFVDFVFGVLEAQAGHHAEFLDDFDLAGLVLVDGFGEGFGEEAWCVGVFSDVLADQGNQGVHVEGVGASACRDLSVQIQVFLAEGVGIEGELLLEGGVRVRLETRSLRSQISSDLESRVSSLVCSITSSNALLRRAGVRPRTAISLTRVSWFSVNMWYFSFG